MDLIEAAAQKRTREREDAARATVAKQDPRASTGGTGWERSGYHAVADSAALPAAPKTAQEMGGAVDTGEPPKEYGINQP